MGEANEMTKRKMRLQNSMIYYAHCAPIFDHVSDIMGERNLPAEKLSRKEQRSFQDTLGLKSKKCERFERGRTEIHCQCPGQRL